MKREVKVEEVKRLKDKFQLAKCIILTDFSGLSVREMSSLRRKFREESIDYRVVKNTLAYLAIKETEFKDLSRYLFGQTAIAFSFKDEVSPAKILVRFNEEHKKPEIKAGVINKEVIDKGKVLELANLPGREVLLAKLIMGVQAPLCMFVYSLNSLLQRLLYTINAIKIQKEKS